MSVSQKVRDTVAAIDRALAGLPEVCTVPLLVQRYAYTVPYATGTLLQVGPAHFIVTAGHALFQAAADGLVPLVGGLDGSRVFRIPGDSYRTPRTDPADIAVWRLRPEDVLLFHAKRFLTLHDLWVFPAPHDPGPGVYTLHGYLADEEGAGGPDMPAGYVNSARMYMEPYRGEAPGEPYDPRVHLLFNGNVRFQFDIGGEPIALPWSGYMGVSGGGILRVRRRDDRPRIVAIGIGTHESQRAYQGTRVHSLLQLIGNVFPNTIPAIGEHLATLDPDRPD